MRNTARHIHIQRHSDIHMLGYYLIVQFHMDDIVAPDRVFLLYAFVQDYILNRHLATLLQYCPLMDAGWWYFLLDSRQILSMCCHWVKHVQEKTVLSLNCVNDYVSYGSMDVIQAMRLFPCCHLDAETNNLDNS